MENWKKYLIIAAVVVAVIIAVVLYFSFTPTWASLQVVFSGIGGLLVGGAAVWAYYRYIKKN